MDLYDKFSFASDKATIDKHFNWWDPLDPCSALEIMQTASFKIIEKLTTEPEIRI